MSEKQDIKVQIRSLAELAGAMGRISDLVKRGLAGGVVVVTLGRLDRTTDQNAKFHPMVRDIKKHLGERFPMLKTEKHWRDWLVCQFKGHIAAPSLDYGQVIMVATKGTSDLNKTEGSEFIEWLYATGTQEGVTWSEPALKAYEEISNEVSD